MTAKNFGCVGIVNQIGDLKGIVTDGDLRRHMTKGVLNLTAAEVMNPNVRKIRPSALASGALQLMNDSKITGVFVLEEKEIVGLLHIHDCLRAGLA
jgi:arabinose-5-phosphate isomerase